ncbi:MAG: ATP-binding protein, partial [Rhodocyclaceae bacterium]|nr:ATP-binding protein [Rhodocyclaceae bacterium]
RFETKVLAAFVGAALVVAALAVTTWRVTQNALEGALWLSHTHEIIGHLADTKSDSLQIELSTQNFRVSGDPARLVERDAAIAARETTLRRIKELTADNARQQALWAQMRGVIDERLAISRRSEHLRKTEGAEAANAYVAGAPLAETRARLFQIFREMGDEEHRLLVARETTAAGERDRALAIGALTSLLLIALLTATYTLIRRQLRAAEASRAALAASNERIRAILDSIGEGLHGIDLNGNFVFANPPAITMLGWDLPELLGQPAHALMHHTRADGSPYPKEECHVYATSRDGVLRHVEDEVFWRKDGTSFPVAYTSTAMRNAAGELAGVVVSFLDITARKQAEQALIAAKNAADLANRSKDSFLATMSHEIRTPLGGLLGMLELLSLSPLNREQTETLQTARDSGHSLLRILNDILDWSKIEEGKLELTPQATSIEQLVTEIANTYAHVASANSVMLTRQVDLRLSSALMVDPLRLSQVLNNFVSNAIKFSHGGRVEIRGELVERRDAAEEVRFAVQDTGIGIEPEVQQRLFLRYGQASATTARMYGGTGLGLAICRRLATLMGGRIALDSAPGRGSTFSITLTLPIAKAVVETAPGPAERTATASEPHVVHGAAATDAPLVLVVDDNPVNRKLLARQLGLLGLRAATAENGQAALSLWRDGRYALVITDCHMPELDGYALTRAIRASEAVAARPRTPIFAWTANALRDEIEKCRAAGMDELLVKPADLAQLKQVLAKWLLIVAEARPEHPLAPAPQAGSPPAVDVSVLAAQVGDDPATLREFLLDFRASAVGIAAELAAAIAAGDAPRVGALAHKLKSSARAVGALALGEICAELEKAGKVGRVGALAGMMAKLDAEMAAVDAALAELTARHKTENHKGETS